LRRTGGWTRRLEARFDELKSTLPHSFTGFEYDFEHVWAECTPEKRREVLEEIYEDGSLKLWLANFGEVFFDMDVSHEISESSGRRCGPASRTSA
jgi:cyclohexanone monooxygenase/acetone monooxygenase